MTFESLQDHLQKMINHLKACQMVGFFIFLHGISSLNEKVLFCE